MKPAKTFARHSVLWVPVLAAFVGTITLACIPPPPETISYTWLPLSVVVIQNSGVPADAVTAAAGNWASLTGVNPIVTAAICNWPGFENSSGGLPTILLSYGTISAGSAGDNVDVEPNQGRVIRGQTDLSNASFSGGRLQQVNMIVNSSVTNGDAIREVLAHEIGHTMGLTDPQAGRYSSVMESGDVVSDVNDLIGNPGPTTCDADRAAARLEAISQMADED